MDEASILNDFAHSKQRSEQSATARHIAVRFRTKLRIFHCVCYL